tara:strand:- start:3533 stop:4285 length:753 start_codon:yes stop_codon:yes gene_type:complete
MNKSYYAVIPADVRYDVRLTPNAKLLYGEITALCNEKGFCWAMNEYFAELYSVSKVSVSKWVGNLRDCGYIEVQMQYKEGTKQIIYRYIKIITPAKEIFNTPHKEILKTLTRKSLMTSQRKVKGPHKEKFKDNNTINNTVNNTINTGGTSSPCIPKKKGSIFVKPTLAEVTDYCNCNVYTIDPQNFLDFYDSKGWLIGKNKMKDWQAACRTWQNNDNKRNGQNANRKSADERRSDYASEIRDYGKAIRNF